MERPYVVYLEEMSKDEGVNVWGWDISDSEIKRLNALFGRDFRELNVGSTYVTCPPQRCPTCKKWTEFIDWYVLFSRAPGVGTKSGY